MSLPIRTSILPALTKILTHTSLDFFDSIFQGDSIFEENITNSSDSCYSSYSSFSVSAEHSLGDFESALESLSNSSEHISPSTQQQRYKRKNTSKETYDLRKKLLSVENERIQMIAELKRSIDNNTKNIDNNNKIQQERNDLLKKLLEKT